METSSRPPFFKKALYEAKASGLQYDVRIYWHVLDKRVSHSDYSNGFWDAFGDLVPFEQFKKSEKNIHGVVSLLVNLQLQSAIALKVTLLHKCFSHF